MNISHAGKYTLQTSRGQTGYFLALRSASWHHLLPNRISCPKYQLQYFTLWWRIPGSQVGAESLNIVAKKNRPTHLSISSFSFFDVETTKLEFFGCFGVVGASLSVSLSCIFIQCSFIRFTKAEKVAGIRGTLLCCFQLRRSVPKYDP